MHISGTEKLLWALGAGLDLLLLCVLLWRRRWRPFPIFTSWIALQNIRTPVMFFLYLHGLAPLYRQLYWTLAWVDFAIQLGVVLEIARIVLRPTGTWVRDARMLFLLGAFGGIVVAALFAWWISPPAETPLMAWHIRCNLFTSLVTCELFVAMSMTANRLGLGWRSHVMALGQGLTGWAAIMVLTTAMQSYWGTGHYWVLLDNIRVASYLLATAWLSVQLWRNEPERQPIDPRLRNYILALHRRVEYDLRRIDA